LAEIIFCSSFIDWSDCAANRSYETTNSSKGQGFRRDMYDKFRYELTLGLPNQVFARSTQTKIWPCNSDLMYRYYLEEVPNIQGTLNVIIFCTDHLITCQNSRLLKALKCHSRGAVIIYRAYVLYNHDTRSL
jgi:hypothetical protein